jgi:hypothetical protein
VSKESRRAARAARESRRLGAAGTGRTPADGDRTTEAATPAGVGVRRPAGTATRAGRRERVRRYHEPTFLERYRSLLIGIAGVVVLAVVVGVVFISSTQPVYACSNIFDPSPTPTVSPGSSIRLGFAEEDMGNSHVVSRPQRYLYCPPASGNHLNISGQGPIVPRVFKPGDNVGPPNWVHNLEHGALVVLYRPDSPGATAEGLAAFRQFFDNFPASPICKLPPGQLSPVIAPFTDMPHPYALLVWDRVLYLDAWDPGLAIRFYNEESERLDKDGALVAPPEKQCTLPSASPAPVGSAPSAAPSADAFPAPSGSPEPSPAAS